MAIYCCKGCVAPKRHPGCHDHCPEYQAEKAQHDEERAAMRKKQKTESGLTSQMLNGVEKAKKAQRRMKGR